MDRERIQSALGILGLGLGASEEEIKLAYRDLVRVWHPDRFVNDERLRAKADAKLREINLAYEEVTKWLGQGCPITASPADSDPSPGSQGESSPASPENGSKETKWSWPLRMGLALFAIALAVLGLWWNWPRDKSGASHSTANAPQIKGPMSTAVEQSPAQRNVNSRDSNITGGVATAIPQTNGSTMIASSSIAPVPAKLVLPKTNVSTAKTYVALVGGRPAASGGAGARTEWLHSLPSAQVKSKAEGKPIFLFFNGSDWAKTAQKWQEEVGSKEEFTEYARKNLILVELDFPRPNNGTQTEAEKTTIRQLKDQYKVAGYPTFILVDAEGKEIGRRLGYTADTPAGFITRIEKMKSPKQAKQL